MGPLNFSQSVTWLSPILYFHFRLHDVDVANSLLPLPSMTWMLPILYFRFHFHFHDADVANSLLLLQLPLLLP